jgi:[ribosomal protein S18]-alanine N-acetyltransferase
MMQPVSNTDRPLAFVPLDETLLPLVAEVEKTAYSHPWSLRHLRDSLLAGHLAQLLVTPPDPLRDPPAWLQAPALPDGRWLLGYCVAMRGVDEVHLLNLTTVPVHRRQGWARGMLQALSAWAMAQGLQAVWLEVRASNQAALALYQAEGFQAVGRRRGYYPDAGGRREDAIVMSRSLA